MLFKNYKNVLETMRKIQEKRKKQEVHILSRIHMENEFTIAVVNIIKGRKVIQS